jgi:hypothetical protein
MSMSLAAHVARMQEALGPCFEGVIQPSSTGLSTLLEGISDARCTAEEFTRAARSLSPQQARMLLAATLHRSMAYSSEMLPLETAKELASSFVSAAGAGAQFYSTCYAEDEVSGVGNWHVIVTGHTFESVLYCVGAHESALLVVTDED